MEYHHLSQIIVIFLTPLAFVTDVKSEPPKHNKNYFITKVTIYICQSSQGKCTALLSPVTKALHYKTPIGTFHRY